MSQTVVSVHAHPDDETLYTGGTLAGLAARGHRVVLVTATAGEAGLAARAVGGPDQLALQRATELAAAARCLGVARVVQLGFGDSGSTTRSDSAHRLADAPVQQVADRVAQVLDEEGAALVTSYDRNGGYGHPDHVAVHRAVRAAVAATGTRLLEATVDRERLRQALRLVGWLPGLPPGFSAAGLADCYTARAELTHQVDVRAHLPAKRAALAAHASQAGSDSGTRTLRVLLGLPRPLLRAVLGTEWFVDPAKPAGARPAGTGLSGDVLTER